MRFLAVHGRLAPDDIPELCERARALLRITDEDLLCDLAAANPDVVTVDAIARLQLTARRLGRRVHLRSASQELRDLLALTGLCEVVPGLGVEALGKPEEWEEVLGVEEEGDPRDLAT